MGSDPPFDPSEIEGSAWARFERVAAARGDALAVTDELGSSTYAELHTRAEGLGRFLRDRGSGPVGLLISHERSTIAAYLGILASGRTVVPLDPGMATTVLDVVERAGIEVLVSCRPAPAVAEQVEVVLIDPDDWPDGPGPLEAIDGDHPAVVYFTSGSSGRPKGSLLLHRALVSSAYGAAVEGLVVVDDRVALLAPLNSSASGFFLWLTLLNGARLDLYGVRANGLPATLDFLHTSDTTVIPTLTSLGRRLATGLSGRPLPHLRVVMAGGERFESSDLGLLRTMGVDVPTIVDLYACSELIVMGMGIVAPDADAAQARLGVTPFHDRRLRVVDDDGAVLQEGPGEIVVDAPMVALGYLGETGATDQAFTFDQAAGRLTYRTGDVGCVDGGSVQVLGRTDSMVKVHGFRVQLEDVERLLSGLQEVLDAAVVTVESATGGPMLVAHVVVDQPEVTAAADVRRALAAIAPDHLVPGRIVVHEAIPRLPTSKPDRRRLAELSLGAETEYVGPLSSLEALVAHLWESSFQLPVGRHDDVFELGVDSLLILETIGLIEEQTGLHTTAADLLEHPTIADLCAFVDLERSQTREAVRSSVVQIQRGDGEGPPLVLCYDLEGSPTQMRSLASAIGADQTVLGLSCPYLLGQPGDPSDLRGLAALHRADLHVRQPEGPYLIAGYSCGALLAYELAWQLRDAGHEVAFLGLIDLGPVLVRHRHGRAESLRPPGSWAWRPQSDLGLVERARDYAAHARSLGRDEGPAYVARALNVGRDYDLLRCRADLRRRGVVRPELRLEWTWYRLLDATFSYEPRDYAGSAVLFHSDQTARGNTAASRRLDHTSATDPLLGWGPLVKDLDVRPVVGYHSALIQEPYVGGLGREVRRALDGALAGRTP